MPICVNYLADCCSRGFLRRFSLSLFWNLLSAGFLRACAGRVLFRARQNPPRPEGRGERRAASKVSRPADNSSALGCSPRLTGRPETIQAGGVEKLCQLSGGELIWQLRSPRSPPAARLPLTDISIAGRRLAALPIRRLIWRRRQTNEPRRGRGRRRCRGSALIS